MFYSGGMIIIEGDFDKPPELSKDPNLHHYKSQPKIKTYKKANELEDTSKLKSFRKSSLEKHDNTKNAGLAKGK